MMTICMHSLKSVLYKAFTSQLVTLLYTYLVQLANAHSLLVLTYCKSRAYFFLSFFLITFKAQAKNLSSFELYQLQVFVSSGNMKIVNIVKHFLCPPAELEEAHQAGRIGSLITVESGHSIGTSLAVLRMFHRLGARSLTLTHNCNTPW